MVSTKIPLEVLRLHKQNWAIHWLRPNSKIPVQSGWSKGPRLDLDGLQSAFRPGFNPGVRLGEASKFSDGTYLAVLDVDIKSKKQSHYHEAIHSLHTLYPQTKDSPYLLSGRGQGSCHYYVRLKEPVSGDEIKARSSEVVKVVMPSVKPSKLERERLDEADLAEGIRLRPAWEVQLLSTGRQAAIVGSSHPDTGNRYKWGKKVGDSLKDIPLINPVVLLKGVGHKAGTKIQDLDILSSKIEIEEVDVEELQLKTEHVQAIVDGVGVYDRSAKVYSLCMTLMRMGVSDAQIRGVFTCQDYYLGQVAYDHAKTTSRVRAARWLERYCLTKARKNIPNTDLNFDIAEIPKTSKGVDAMPLPLPKTAQGFKNLEGWRAKLSLNYKTKLPKVRKDELQNIKLILENTKSPLLVRNSFALNDSWGANTPWGSKKGSARSSDDVDSLKIKLWFAKKYGIEPNTALINDALNVIANENSFHPVQDYLNSLQWDNIPRVENAFKTYLGAQGPEPYTTEICTKFFAAAVKRIFEPGCKFDHIVVLEGEQGIGKSTFGEMLASKTWFLDGLPNFADKDAALYLQGAWICEISELAALYKSANESTKAFIARNTDKFRRPYGRVREDFARTTVFLGTTNDHEYLTDPSGNRRFWPIQVTKCDFKKLAKDRDQLWAEAMSNYIFDDEKLYLEGEAKLQAEGVQALRQVDDISNIMSERFLNWVSAKVKLNEPIGTLTTAGLFEDGPFNQLPISLSNLHKVGRILRKAGFIKTHTRNGKVWKINKKAI